MTRSAAVSRSRTAVHSQSGLLTLRQLVLQAVRHLRHHLPFIAEKRAALGAGPAVSMTPEQVTASYDRIAGRWLDVSIGANVVGRPFSHPRGMEKNHVAQVVLEAC
jgi:hypothetical protein